MILIEQHDWPKRAKSPCLQNKRIWTSSYRRKEWRKEWQLLSQMNLASILARRIGRSCWKNNNEKNKIVVGLWKSSQHIWGDNQPLKETRIDWEKQDMNNFLHQEDTLRTWINDKHHDSTIHRKIFRWNPNQDSSMKKSWVANISWL